MDKDVTDLRVLIVADDPLARAGLAALLADQPDCLVVAQVAEDADLLSALDVYRPHVVVWDLGWERRPSNRDFAVRGDLRRRSPNCWCPRSFVPGHQL
jgi:DNA-binding NarL/FixJ family response regulator